MTPANAVAAEERLDALRERKHLLDDVWLLALFVMFVAVGLPWYLRILEINFAPVVWSLFAYGAIYLVTSSAADGLRSRRALVAVIGALQVAGVLFIGFVWHLTGSLQNPMFLLMFVLPLIAGSLVLVNWQSYAMALLSIATVFAVALIDAPELRWYVAQAGRPADRLMHLLPQTPAAAQPFPSLNTPPSFLFILLLLFTLAIITAALVTESLTSFLLRLYGRLESSTSALSVAEGLSSKVLQASPSPTALVYADTFKVVQASKSFLEHLLLPPESLLDQSLFGLVDFAYPEVVEELIVGAGGEIPLAVYRVDGELRAARVRVDPVNHGGRHYAYVNMQDISDLEYLHAALNAIDEVLIVIDASQHVQYCNQAAGSLFPAAEPGMLAATLLRQGNLPEGWWELGARTRQTRLVEFNGRRFEATCVSARILGEKEALVVLTMRASGAPR